MIILGWRERVGLPELGIESMKTKLDTSQRISLLHVNSLQSFQRGGEEWLRFAVRPDPATTDIIVSAALLKARSGTRADASERLLIETPLSLGDRTYPIGLTLTTAPPADFALIIGRSALKRDYVIDPNRSYLRG
jgi:hypothetical protein